MPPGNIMGAENFTSRFCRKCLSQSLPVNMMVRFARIVYPEYNVYRRTGLSEGMPLSNQSAAQYIVSDMIRDGRFIDFVEALIRIDAAGYMGRRYALKGLNDVVTGLIQDGYSYDPVSAQFFENQRERISPNWGRLNEGDERKMTLLRLDIAGNSQMVRQNPRNKIEKAYADLRLMVNRAVTSRLGRLWSWEGDGALAAFLFGPIEKSAVFCGMDILHDVFFYNRLKNPLSGPLALRIGVHIGPVRYSGDETERLKNDTVKQALALEARAAVNSMGVSYNVFITMDQNTVNLFGPEQNGPGGKYRLYKLGLAKS
jgi:class 3 adenylate cyclase